MLNTIFGNTNSTIAPTPEGQPSAASTLMSAASESKPIERKDEDDWTLVDKLEAAEDDWALVDPEDSVDPDYIDQLSLITNTDYLHDYELIDHQTLIQLKAQEIAQKATDQIIAQAITCSLKQERVNNAPKNPTQTVDHKQAQSRHQAQEFVDNVLTEATQEAGRALKVSLRNCEYIHKKCYLPFKSKPVCRREEEIPHDNQVDRYTVHPLNLEHKGLKCSVWVPNTIDNNKVFILWAGTMCTESLRIDTQITPGHDTYLKRENNTVKEINHIIQALISERQKADPNAEKLALIIGGHSLGGALAQYTTLSILRALCANSLPVEQEQSLLHAYRDEGTPEHYASLQATGHAINGFTKENISTLTLSTIQSVKLMIKNSPGITPAQLHDCERRLAHLSQQGLHTECIQANAGEDIVQCVGKHLIQAQHWGKRNLFIVDPPKIYNSDVKRITNFVIPAIASIVSASSSALTFLTASMVHMPISYYAHTSTPHVYQDKLNAKQKFLQMIRKKFKGDGPPQVVLLTDLEKISIYCERKSSTLFNFLAKVNSEICRSQHDPCISTVPAPA